MSIKITGGYVRFTLFDEERTHNFTATDELGWLEHYVAIGRAEKGLKDFIRMKYIHPAMRKQLLTQDQIRVIAYEFT
jgi:hypothetical protein